MLDTSLFLALRIAFSASLNFEKYLLYAASAAKFLNDISADHDNHCHKEQLWRDELA